MAKKDMPPRLAKMDDKGKKPKGKKATPKGPSYDQIGKGKAPKAGK